MPKRNSMKKRVKIEEKLCRIVKRQERKTLDIVIKDKVVTLVYKRIDPKRL
jgi:hypothetical protein